MIFYIKLLNKNKDSPKMQDKRNNCVYAVVIRN